MRNDWHIGLNLNLAVLSSPPPALADARAHHPGQHHGHLQHHLPGRCDVKAAQSGAWLRQPCALRHLAGWLSLS